MIDYNTLNLTTFKGVWSTITACVLLVLVTVAVLFFDFEPTPVKLTVLKVVALVLLTMMGYDVTQYIGKRLTDRDYRAVKNNPPPIVEHAEEVNVARAPTATFEVKPQQRGEVLTRRVAVRVEKKEPDLESGD